MFTYYLLTSLKGDKVENSKMKYWKSNEKSKTWYAVYFIFMGNTINVELKIPKGCC